MVKRKVPLKEVMDLMMQGYNDAEIISHLRSAGYSPVEINDAINQAKIKRELGRAALEEAEEEMIPSIMETEGEVPVPGAETTEMVPTETTVEAELPGPGYYESYEAYGYAPSAEAIEELVKETVDAKWQSFQSKFAELLELKEIVEMKLKKLEERMRKIELKFDKIHLGMISQMREYASKVDNLDKQIEMLQQTFSQILQPLVTRVKELKEINEKKAEKIKKKK